MRKAGPGKRFISVVLVAALFIGQTALPYAAESNVWLERRQHATVPRSSFQLALLPQTAPVHVVFPAASALPSSFFIPSFDSSHFSSSVRALLPPLSNSPGFIRRISIPSDGRVDRVVIQVQDIHQNFEAQTNIQKTVENLVGDQHVSLIALEGAFDILPIGAYRSYPNPSAVRKAAAYLFKEKELSGPVMAALMSRVNPPPVVGIDQKTAYDRNVEAVRDSARDKKQADDELALEQRNLSEEKRHAFGGELKTFDEKVQAYRSGGLSLRDYVHAVAVPSRTLAKNTRCLLRALDAESTLDFQHVETERARLLAKLSSSLSSADGAQLLNAAMAFRSGGLSSGRFYGLVEKLCTDHGVTMDSFPLMKIYLRYVADAESLDTNALFTELRDLERNRYAGLCRTEEERRLVETDRFLFLAKRLFDHALTREEWREYLEISNSKIDWELKIKNWELRPFESFYEQAELRDSAMAHNLLHAMDVAHAKKAVAVIGGFHSEGIEALLLAAHTAVILFQPKVTKVDDAAGNMYLNVFLQEKTPLQKLFEGPKLFLATKPMDTDGFSTATLIADGAEGKFSSSRMALLPGAGDLALVVSRDLPTEIAGTLTNVMTGVVEKFRATKNPFQVFYGDPSESIKTQVKRAWWREEARFALFFFDLPMLLLQWYLGAPTFLEAASNLPGTPLALFYFVAVIRLSAYAMMAVSFGFSHETVRWFDRESGTYKEKPATLRHKLYFTALGLLFRSIGVLNLFGLSRLPSLLNLASLSAFPGHWIYNKIAKRGGGWFATDRGLISDSLRAGIESLLKEHGRDRPHRAVAWGTDFFISTTAEQTVVSIPRALSGQEGNVLKGLEKKLDEMDAVDYTFARLVIDRIWESSDPATTDFSSLNELAHNPAVSNPQDWLRVAEALARVVVKERDEKRTPQQIRITLCAEVDKLWFLDRGQIVYAQPLVAHAGPATAVRVARVRGHMSVRILGQDLDYYKIRRLISSAKTGIILAWHPMGIFLGDNTAINDVVNEWEQVAEEQSHVFVEDTGRFNPVFQSLQKLSAAIRHRYQARTAEALGQNYFLQQILSARDQRLYYEREGKSVNDLTDDWAAFAENWRTRSIPPGSVAQKMWDDMLSKPLIPSEPTISALFNLCSFAGALESVRRGASPSIVLCEWIVIYAKALKTGRFSDQQPFYGLFLLGRAFQRAGWPRFAKDRLGIDFEREASIETFQRIPRDSWGQMIAALTDVAIENGGALRAAFAVVDQENFTHEIYREPLFEEPNLDLLRINKNPVLPPARLPGSNDPIFDEDVPLEVQPALIDCLKTFGGHWRVVLSDDRKTKIQFDPGAATMEFQIGSYYLDKEIIQRTQTPILAPLAPGEIIHGAESFFPLPQHRRAWVEFHFLHRALLGWIYDNHAGPERFRLFANSLSADRREIWERKNVLRQLEQAWSENIGWGNTAALQACYTVLGEVWFEGRYLLSLRPAPSTEQDALENSLFWAIDSKGHTTKVGALSADVLQVSLVKPTDVVRPVIWDPRGFLLICESRLASLVEDLQKLGSGVYMGASIERLLRHDTMRAGGFETFLERFRAYLSLNQRIDGVMQGLVTESGVPIRTSHDVTKEIERYARLFLKPDGFAVMAAQKVSRQQEWGTTDGGRIVMANVLSGSRVVHTGIIGEEPVMVVLQLLRTLATIEDPGRPGFSFERVILYFLERSLVRNEDWNKDSFRFLYDEIVTGTGSEWEDRAASVVKFLTEDDAATGSAKNKEERLRAAFQTIAEHELSLDHDSLRDALGLDADGNSPSMSPNTVPEKPLDVLHDLQIPKSSRDEIHAFVRINGLAQRIYFRLDTDEDKYASAKPRRSGHILGPTATFDPDFNSEGGCIVVTFDHRVVPEEILRIKEGRSGNRMIDGFLENKKELEPALRFARAEAHLQALQRIVPAVKTEKTVDAYFHVGSSLPERERDRWIKLMEQFFGTPAGQQLRRSVGRLGEEASIATLLPSAFLDFLNRNWFGPEEASLAVQRAQSGRNGNIIALTPLYRHGGVIDIRGESHAVGYVEDKDFKKPARDGVVWNPTRTLLVMLDWIGRKTQRVMDKAGKPASDADRKLFYEHYLRRAVLLREEQLAMEASGPFVPSDEVSDETHLDYYREFKLIPGTPLAGVAASLPVHPLRYVALQLQSVAAGSFPMAVLGDFIDDTERLYKDAIRRSPALQRSFIVLWYLVAHEAKVPMASEPLTPSILQKFDLDYFQALIGALSNVDEKTLREAIETICRENFNGSVERIDFVDDSITGLPMLVPVKPFHESDWLRPPSVDLSEINLSAAQKEELREFIEKNVPARRVKIVSPTKAATTSVAFKDDELVITIPQKLLNQERTAWQTAQEKAQRGQTPERSGNLIIDELKKYEQEIRTECQIPIYDTLVKGLEDSESPEHFLERLDGLSARLPERWRGAWHSNVVNAFTASSDFSHWKERLTKLPEGKSLSLADKLEIVDGVTEFLNQTWFWGQNLHAIQVKGQERIRLVEIGRHGGTWMLREEMRSVVYLLNLDLGETLSAWSPLTTLIFPIVGVRRYLEDRKENLRRWTNSPGKTVSGEAPQRLISVIARRFDEFGEALEHLFFDDNFHSAFWGNSLMVALKRYQAESPSTFKKPLAANFPLLLEEENPLRALLPQFGEPKIEDAYGQSRTGLYGYTLAAATAEEPAMAFILYALYLLRSSHADSADRAILYQIAHMLEVPAAAAPITREIVLRLDKDTLYGFLERIIQEETASLRTVLWAVVGSRRLEQRRLPPLIREDRDDFPHIAVNVEEDGQSFLEKGRPRYTPVWNDVRLRTPQPLVHCEWIGRNNFGVPEISRKEIQAFMDDNGLALKFKLVIKEKKNLPKNIYKRVTKNEDNSIEIQLSKETFKQEINSFAAKSREKNFLVEELATLEPALRFQRNDILATGVWNVPGAEIVRGDFASLRGLRNLLPDKYRSEWDGLVDDFDREKYRPWKASLGSGDLKGKDSGEAGSDFVFNLYLFFQTHWLTDQGYQALLVQARTDESRQFHFYLAPLFRDAGSYPDGTKCLLVDTSELQSHQMPRGIVMIDPLTIEKNSGRAFLMGTAALDHVMRLGWFGQAELPFKIKPGSPLQRFFDDFPTTYREPKKIEGTKQMIAYELASFRSGGNPDGVRRDLIDNTHGFSYAYTTPLFHLLCQKLGLPEAQDPLGFQKTLHIAEAAEPFVQRLTAATRLELADALNAIFDENIEMAVPTLTIRHDDPSGFPVLPDAPPYAPRPKLTKPEIFNGAAAPEADVPAPAPVDKASRKRAWRRSVKTPEESLNAIKKEKWIDLLIAFDGNVEVIADRLLGDTDVAADQRVPMVLLYMEDKLKNKATLPLNLELREVLELIRSGHGSLTRMTDYANDKKWANKIPRNGGSPPLLVRDEDIQDTIAQWSLEPYATDVNEKRAAAVGVDPLERTVSVEEMRAIIARVLRPSEEPSLWTDHAHRRLLRQLLAEYHGRYWNVGNLLGEQGTGDESHARAQIRNRVAAWLEPAELEEIRSEAAVWRKQGPPARQIFQWIVENQGRLGAVAERAEVERSVVEGWMRGRTVEGGGITWTEHALRLRLACPSVEEQSALIERHRGNFQKIAVEREIGPLDVENWIRTNSDFRRTYWEKFLEPAIHRFGGDMDALARYMGVSPSDIDPWFETNGLFEEKGGFLRRMQDDTAVLRLLSAHGLAGAFAMFEGADAQLRREILESLAPLFPRLTSEEIATVDRVVIGGFGQGRADPLNENYENTGEHFVIAINGERRFPRDAGQSLLTLPTPETQIYLEMSDFPRGTTVVEIHGTLPHVLRLPVVDGRVTLSLPLLHLGGLHHFHVTALDESSDNPDNWSRSLTMSFDVLQENEKPISLNEALYRLWLRCWKHWDPQRQAARREYGLFLMERYIIAKGIDKTDPSDVLLIINQEITDNRDVAEIWEKVRDEFIDMSHRVWPKFREGQEPLLYQKWLAYKIWQRAVQETPKGTLLSLDGGMGDTVVVLMALALMELNTPKIFGERKALILASRRTIEFDWRAVARRHFQDLPIEVLNGQPDPLQVIRSSDKKIILAPEELLETSAGDSILAGMDKGKILRVFAAHRSLLAQADGRIKESMEDQEIKDIIAGDIKLKKAFLRTQAAPQMAALADLVRVAVHENAALFRSKTSQAAINWLALRKSGVIPIALGSLPLGEIADLPYFEEAIGKPFEAPVSRRSSAPVDVDTPQQLALSHDATTGWTLRLTRDFFLAPTERARVQERRKPQPVPFPWTREETTGVVLHLLSDVHVVHGVDNDLIDLIDAGEAKLDELVNWLNARPDSKTVVIVHKNTSLEKIFDRLTTAGFAPAFYYAGKMFAAQADKQGYRVRVVDGKKGARILYRTDPATGNFLEDPDTHLPIEAEDDEIKSARAMDVRDYQRWVFERTDSRVIVGSSDMRNVRMPRAATAFYHLPANPEVMEQIANNPYPGSVWDVPETFLFVGTYDAGLAVAFSRLIVEAFFPEGSPDQAQAQRLITRTATAKQIFDFPTADVTTGEFRDRTAIIPAEPPQPPSAHHSEPSGSRTRADDPEVLDSMLDILRLERRNLQRPERTERGVVDFSEWMKTLALRFYNTRHADSVQMRFNDVVEEDFFDFGYDAMGVNADAWIEWLNRVHKKLIEAKNKREADASALNEDAPGMPLALSSLLWGRFILPNLLNKTWKKSWHLPSILIAMVVLEEIFFSGAMVILFWGIHAASGSLSPLTVLLLRGSAFAVVQIVFGFSHRYLYVYDRKSGRLQKSVSAEAHHQVGFALLGGIFRSPLLWISFPEIFSLLTLLQLSVNWKAIGMHLVYDGIAWEKEWPLAVTGGNDGEWEWEQLLHTPAGDPELQVERLGTGSRKKSQMVLPVTGLDVEKVMHFLQARPGTHFYLAMTPETRSAYAVLEQHYHDRLRIEIMDERHLENLRVEILARALVVLPRASLSDISRRWRRTDTAT